MRKSLYWIVLVLALAVSSCAGGDSSPAATISPTENAAPVTEAVPSATEVGMAPTAAGPTSEPACTVVSAAPTPGPTEQSLFPAVSDKDWVVGPADAQVTILEYSDFM